MDKLKLKIVELIDEGHTLESSRELQALISESEELKKFHADLLRSETRLEDFMNQEGVAEVQADLKDFIDQELGLKETKQTSNTNSYLPAAAFEAIETSKGYSETPLNSLGVVAEDNGAKSIYYFAIAAGFMLFAFNFFMPMGQDDTFVPAIPETFALVEPEMVVPEVIEEPNAVYFVELQENETLWNKSGELASELNVDRYQVMYALYEANKDSFANNDINKIQYGQELVLQEEMIFAMSPGEANDVVNRHIYCGC